MVGPICRPTGAKSRRSHDGRCPGLVIPSLRSFGAVHGKSVEVGVTEGEHISVRTRQPVPMPIRSGGDPGDRLFRRHAVARQRAEVLGVAPREDPAVQTYQPGAITRRCYRSSHDWSAQRETRPAAGVGAAGEEVRPGGGCRGNDVPAAWASGNGVVGRQVPVRRCR